MSNQKKPGTNNLEAHWMPYTANRNFKKNPLFLQGAQGMYYFDPAGRKILDGAAGLWCVNAGHNIPRITKAIQEQAEQVDYVTHFSLGHVKSFEAASKLTSAMPWDFNHVFFSNSGSEAVDTALKIALAYQRARGKDSKTLLIGRDRGYHGCNFGGMSVGGIPYNRKVFKAGLLQNTDHLPHTHDISRNAFSKGEPEHGIEYADHLETMIKFHYPENIAAVIIEPVAGSTGVLPPPKGYLKRIKELCEEHDILLIFDEVVCAFGRFGTLTASEYFDVKPDIITSAKGLTNGAVPMGATFVRDHIYDAFMQGPESTIEIMHGYTYSGHPLASVAAIATLETFQEDKLFDNASGIMDYFQDQILSLQEFDGIFEDIRTIGLLAGLDFKLKEGEDPIQPKVYADCFERGLAVRKTGKQTLIFSPPVCLKKEHVDEMIGILKESIASIIA